MFNYLLVAGTPHRYIITVARATFNSLIVGNIKSIIISTRRHLIIKKTLFVFRKKFATAGNRKRYYGYEEQRKCPQY